MASAPRSPKRLCELLRSVNGNVVGPEVEGYCREAAAYIEAAAEFKAATERLSVDLVADVDAHLRGSKDGAETYATPAHGWTCFHCGETFRTPGGAALHFGKPSDDRPRCVRDQKSAGINP